VDAPAEAGVAAAVDEDAQPGLDVRLLRRLPPAAERWAFGRLLVGWSGEALDSRATCRVAEIWRAVDYDDGCHPTPVGRASALGVNLGGGRRVVELEVRAVDPLPGPAAATVSLSIDGRPGLAMARADDGRFPDGIYRIGARTASGATVGWYAEVGPEAIE
jgi:hypothetical protein